MSNERRLSVAGDQRCVTIGSFEPTFYSGICFWISDCRIDGGKVILSIAHSRNSNFSRHLSVHSMYVHSSTRMYVYSSISIYMFKYTLYIHQVMIVWQLIVILVWAQRCVCCPWSGDRREDLNDGMRILVKQLHKVDWWLCDWCCVFRNLWDPLWQLIAWNAEK